MPTPSKPKRTSLTKALQKKVIVEARGQCPWCKNPVLAEETEIHHIDGDRSNNTFANLILTCRNHHGQIGAQLIPHCEVELKKNILCNPALIERLGLGSKPVQAPTPSIVGRDNHGIAGQHIHVENLKISRSQSRSRRDVTPGLIEADPDMRTYTDYLVKRYIDWRKKGLVIDRRKFSPGSAHGILGQGFGSPSSVMLVPQTRFFAWILQAQAKINRTVFGKKNLKNGHPNYHSWEVHLQQRRG